jgi:hypothetical protein
MYLLRGGAEHQNSKPAGFAGLGLIGALCSNLTQTALARYFVLGKGAVYIAPAIIGSGIASGFVLGVLCNAFAEKSLWYKTIKENAALEIQAYPKTVFNKKAFIYFLTGAALSLFVIITDNLKIKCAVFFCVLVLFAALRKKNNYLFTIILMLGIIFFNAVFPNGRVLFTTGFFKLTEGALLDGVEKAVTLECLIFISRIFVKKELSFKGKLGSLMGGVFAVLSELNENKSLIKRDKLIESIDGLLIKIQNLN